MSFVYLAAPYSDVDGRVRKHRFRAVCNAAAYLMTRGEVVYSPISHGHPIAKHLVEHDHEFWMTQSVGMLRHASALVVLVIDGWMVSEGVREEIEIARTLGIPIKTLACAVDDDNCYAWSYSDDVNDACDSCDGCDRERSCMDSAA